MLLPTMGGRFLRMILNTPHLCVTPSLIWEYDEMALPWQCHITEQKGDYLGGPFPIPHALWQQSVLWLVAEGSTAVQSMRRTGCAIVGLQMQGAIWEEMAETWSCWEALADNQKGTGDLSPATIRSWILPTTWRNLEVDSSCQIRAQRVDTLTLSFSRGPS